MDYKMLVMRQLVLRVAKIADKASEYVTGLLSKKPFRYYKDFICLVR